MILVGLAVAVVAEAFNRHKSNVQQDDSIKYFGVLARVSWLSISIQSKCFFFSPYERAITIS